MIMDNWSSAASLVQRADDNVADSQYNYIPTEWVCALFVALFALSSAVHTGQMIRYRMWWLIPTVILAGLGETLGWSARLWSSQNPPNGTPFLIQISVTIISPTPLVAANFLILGRIIRRLGTCYSRLSPKYYMIVFLTCDIVALVVQAAGGGIASSADTQSGTALGANIMLGGIVFQMVAITFYAMLAAEFLFRYMHDKPARKVSVNDPTEGGVGVMDKQLVMMVGALAFSTTCIFIRSVYRTIELSDGWNGRIISTQVYFNVLDGAMITLAIFTLNFFHPGRLLKGADSPSIHDPEMKLHSSSAASQTNIV